MPKTCYYGLKSIGRICRYALITPLLAYILYTFYNHDYQGGIGKFIYKASILDNK